MTTTASPSLDRVGALLADQGYEVTPQGEDVLRLRELDSGIVVRAVLEGNILYLSLTCLTLPETSLTPELMRRLLAGDNGISTSYFQTYPAGDGQVAVTLNNFCVLQNMGEEDEDDVLNCVHFLLVDVMQARQVVGQGHFAEAGMQPVGA